ncbi:MAG: tight adherence protein [Actinomycetota bacterium]|jgi:tight adherence protein B|nr:tight adherence protein [Actinomycetota bacterium]MDQ1501116.1 tight adherence protein [Actinomycetota bacterium]MDQ1503753.1 tight adherence protein [Actinomycetota bacterium]
MTPGGARRAILALAGPFVAVILALPGVAWAEGPVVRNVDTSAYPEVKLEVRIPGDAPSLTDFHLRENGAVIPDSSLKVAPLRQTSIPVGTVLVIDTSGSMKTKGAIGAAKAAAHQFIAGRGPNEWTAVVSFSSAAVVRAGFTQDAGTLGAAIESLQPAGETALWDGLTTAAHLYDQRPDLQPNLILLSDGADSISAAKESQAVSALAAAHTAVYAIGIASDAFDPAVLSRLVGASGGSATTSGNPSDLTAQFAKIRSAIENQYEITYRSVAAGGALALDLTAGGVSVAVQTRAGSVGSVAAPTPVKAPHDLFTKAGGRDLLLLLAALAAALGAFALFTIFGRREDTLDNRIGHYGGTAPVLEDAAGAGPGSGFVESSIVRRAVRLTSKMAERGGLLVKVERLLEQANLPLRPAEALFFYGAGVTLLGLLAVTAAPSPAAGLVLAAIVAALPVVVVRQLRKRRLKAFEAQLPDTLNLLSGSLRAGYSFLQGMEAVVQETSDPMARELRRVLAEARLGRPIEDALGDVAVRMESTDFDWSVLAIRIQREVGGNLAELLQTVAETMIQRGRLRGEVKALTAEGRISGVIMGLLPVGLGLFMFTASPGYINDLFNSLTGWSMVIGSTVMAAVGFAWIQKIIKIEV